MSDHQYSYSLAGKKTRLTWPDGTSIDYGYSAHGELETVTIPGEGTISVSEYAWNAPKKTLLPGGSTQNKSYDGLLNLENLSIKTPSQQTTLNLDNRFGKLQELNNRSRTDTGANLSTTKTEQFSFDADNRLTQVQADTGGLFGSNTENFTLDAVGNRIAHSKVSGAWAYDANNRLTQIGSGTCGQSGATCYQYDAAGNLTQKQTDSRTTQYRYDTQNRLIQVSQITDGSTQIITRYGYDPLDRRIWKEQFRDKDGQPLTQAQRTHYLYADEGLIAEVMQAITLNQDGSTSSNGAAQISTQYGPKPESQFTTGMLFIKTKNSNGQDTVAYYHHDHLETPIQATDKAGNMVWAASYEAFGKATITTPQATADKPTITSNLRLPGQYEDSETGLHYNFRRYYDPETGRYISQDPIGLAGGMNTFVYADGSPTTKTGPLGLATYMCTKPRHGLGNKWGPRMYPESKWNPSPMYHQFFCVKDASGKVTCGGQDRTGSAFIPGSPGKSSDDFWPSSGNGSCEKQDDRDCVDQCVIKAVSNPNRPWYAIGPLGTDCQEWGDEALNQCQKQCKAKK